MNFNTELLELQTFTNQTGSLTVFEKIFNSINEVSCLKAEDLTSIEHIAETRRAIACIKGDCEILVEENAHQQSFVLDMAHKCIIIGKDAKYIFTKHSEDIILLSVDE